MKQDEMPNFAAFPGVNQRGMSLRDWFAGQALTGLLADPEFQVSDEKAAKRAYDYATAMIEEAAKRRDIR